MAKLNVNMKSLFGNEKFSGGGLDKAISIDDFKKLFEVTNEEYSKSESCGQLNEYGNVDLSFDLENSDYYTLTIEVKDDCEIQNMYFS